VETVSVVEVPQQEREVVGSEQKVIEKAEIEIEKESVQEEKEEKETENIIEKDVSVEEKTLDNENKEQQQDVSYVVTNERVEGKQELDDEEALINYLEVTRKRKEEILKNIRGIY